MHERAVLFIYSQIHDLFSFYEIAWKNIQIHIYFYN